jgi:hypothetical protein
MSARSAKVVDHPELEERENAEEMRARLRAARERSVARVAVQARKLPRSSVAHLMEADDETLLQWVIAGSEPSWIFFFSTLPWADCRVRATNGQEERSAA